MVVSASWESESGVRLQQNGGAVLLSFSGHPTPPRSGCAAFLETTTHRQPFRREAIYHFTCSKMVVGLWKRVHSRYV